MTTLEGPKVYGWGKKGGEGGRGEGESRKQSDA